MLDSVVCAARRFGRRWLWGLLFVPGLLLYPTLQDRLTASYASTSTDPVQAATEAAGKVVDWVQLYSKLSAAVLVFLLLNGLAWAALNAVMPVLPDWAKGDYREVQGRYPATPGFKGTFLALEGVWRLAFYAVFFWIEIEAAGKAIEVAFRIQ